MNINKILNTKQILNFICYFLIFISLIMAITCILYNANWILGDDWQIVATTAVNKFGLHGQHGEGRYWPLGLYDYNLLVFIKGGHTPFGHYLYNAFILVMFFIAIFYLIKEVVKDNQKILYYFTFFLVILLITKDFMMIHIDVIYPERMMIFMLAIFMLFYLKGLNSDKISHYFTAFFSACYLTYCKEPIFGIFLAISFMNLLFRYKKLSNNEKFFYVALIINSVIYVLQWYFLVFKQTNEFYNLIYTSHLSVLELIYKIVKDKPTFIFVSVIGLIRAYHVLVNKNYEHLFYDSLLFAGIAYIGAFVYLNLIHSYYFLISLLLALPSLVYWIDYGFKSRKEKISIVSMCVIFSFSLYNIELTVEFIKNIHTSREGDMKIIEELESLQKNGKKIVFYEDSRNFVGGWYYKICNSFLRCHYNRNVDIPIITKLEEIKSDNAVLYPPFEVRFKNKIKRVNFEALSFYPIMDTKIGELYVKR